MKIDQAAVAMHSSHELASESEMTFESVSFRSILAGVSQSPASVSATNSDQDSETQLVIVIKRLVAQLLDLLDPQRRTQSDGLADLLQTGMRRTASSNDERTADSKETGATAPTITWQTRYTETVREHEQTDFASTGKVVTTDGRCFDFSFGLSMCRNFEYAREVTETQTAVLRDPLIINLGGAPIDLSGRRFDFDLDADGFSESIPALAGGSGYLAFDRNADGRINDGSELFGTASGNGFADLARLDSDGNHWLDEADPAFASLRVWRPQEATGGTGETLRAAGIGAICLTATATPFTVTDEENRTLGQVRASGIYLCENGQVGSVQQVDLAV